MRSPIPTCAENDEDTKSKTKRVPHLCSGVLNRGLVYVNPTPVDQECETSDSVASCSAQTLSSLL